MKSSTNVTNFQYRKLPEGIRHSIIHHSCKVGNNIGTIKFEFKFKYDKDEGRKLMVI